MKAYLFHICKIHYVNIQQMYVNMRLIHLNMQHNNFDMQHNLSRF